MSTILQRLGKAASDFRSDTKSFENQLIALGTYNLKQNDLTFRIYHTHILNNLMLNPNIEINDKIELLNMEIYETGVPWAAPGGKDSAYSRLLDYWETLHSLWTYLYFPAKATYTYYTAKVELEEKVMKPVLEGEKTTLDEEVEVNERELDAATFMYYQKQMMFKESGRAKGIPQNMVVREIVEHQGMVERPDPLHPWNRQQLQMILSIVGKADFVRYGRQVFAYMFLPEHVNVRTNIVVHSAPAQDSINRILDTSKWGESETPEKGKMPRTSTA